MANKVVQKRRKLCICNERGKRISNIYRDSSIVGRGGDLIYFVDGCSQDGNCILFDIQKGIVIQQIKKEKIIDYRFYEYICYFFGNLYTLNGNLILDNQYIIDHVNFEENEYLVVIDNNTKKYHLLKNDRIECTQCDKITIEKNFIFVIKNGMGYVLNGQSGKYLVKEVPLPQAENYVMTVYGNLVRICYYFHIGKEYELIEVRDTTTLDLLFFLEIEVEKDVNFISHHSHLLLIHERDMDYVYDVRKKERVLEEKIDDIQILNYRYELWKTKDKLCIYDNDKGRVILQGTYTNIRLSKSNKYFILESQELKGAADFQGKILLEPCTFHLYEGEDGFSYLKEEYLSIKI